MSLVVLVTKRQGMPAARSRRSAATLPGTSLSATCSVPLRSMRQPFNGGRSLQEGELTRGWTPRVLEDQTSPVPALQAWPGAQESNCCMSSDVRHGGCCSTPAVRLLYDLYLRHQESGHTSGTAPHLLPKVLMAAGRLIRRRPQSPLLHPSFAVWPILKIIWNWGQRGCWKFPELLRLPSQC